MDNQWTVRLNKYRSIWTYGYTNEVGGGFGSNVCGPKHQALALATRNIPTGTVYRLVVNDKDCGTFTKAGV